MATTDGGGKKRKMGNPLLTTPLTGERDTSGGTNTSGAKGQKDFSDMTPDEIVAIVVNTAVVAKVNLPQMLVANYGGAIPGIVIQIPGWHSINGDIVASGQVQP